MKKLLKISSAVTIALILLLSSCSKKSESSESDNVFERLYITKNKAEINDKLNKTNTVKFFLDDDTTITVRPSGTEPKIKIYFDIIDETEALADNKFKILEKPMREELA